jgi:uncharacterized protein YktA (UPF0223 family)
MRICTTKDGKLIEMQSEATEGTLIKNALNQGYNIEDIVEKEITNDEWVFIDEDMKQKSIISQKEEKQKLINDFENATTILGLKKALKPLLNL